MANTFLSAVANDLTARFGSRLQDVTVVFPGKRASLFLNQELAQTGHTPLWAPEYSSMNSLFQALSPLRIADRIETLCTLLSLMRECIPEEEGRTMDQLWGWGEVILSDFDDIDKHMANAKLVFANVYDQHSLESLDYLTPEQEEALQHFFSNFSIEGNTSIKEKFLHVWSHMYELYTRLKEELAGRGVLYEGALLREVAESIRGRQQTDALDEYLSRRRAIVFAGFNVLNDVEHTLMLEVQRRGKAVFYWDYDQAYVDDRHSEAGIFMKENLRDFPCALDREHYDHLRHLRDVTFISCTTDNAAARYARKWVRGAQDKTANRNAMVLCNESLLHPVLHALPQDVGDVNVTMGFPLADTPIYGLLMALASLQTEGYDRQKGSFSYPFLRAVRRHPYACLLGEESSWAGSWQGADSPTLLTWMDEMLQRIGKHFSGIKEPDAYDMLYMEAIFQTHCTLMKFLRLTQSETAPLDVLPGTMRRLLHSVLLATNIPFHGEPAKGLQVMGVLETRCLDFSHLLMLSVEEGMLPRNTQDETMIPADIREAFGLTTPRHRNAVYAYYFYRLIQRTEHLTCVYNENCTGNTRHEMSRFLRQLLAETDIPIRTLWLRNVPDVDALPAMRIEKTPEIMHRLLHKYDRLTLGSLKVKLSPSAINIYIDCPMKFYFQHVAELQPERNLEEGLQPADMGNIFHDTAQVLYELAIRHTGSRTLTAHILSEILQQAESRVEPILDLAFDVHVFNPRQDKRDTDRYIWQMLEQGKQPRNEYTGELIIYRNVLLQYLKNLLRYDIAHAPVRIIGTEVNRFVTLRIQTEDLKKEIEIETGGRIDRLDEVEGCVRVVDYKTGNHVPDVRCMEQLTGWSPTHEGYYLQTFLYAYAQMRESAPGTNVKPILLYPSKAGAKDYDPTLHIGREVVDNFPNLFAQQFVEALKSRISEIFDPKVPFTQCPDWRACDRCDFRLLCLNHS